MAENTKCSGKFIVDNHTQYELSAYSGGPSTVTLEIPGHVYADFAKRYGKPMKDFDSLVISANPLRNEQLLQECQDPFKPATHRKAVIQSVDDIYPVN